MTTFGLPLTGAASTAVPRSAACARTASDASAETVEESTSTRGATPSADSTPPSSIVTALKSSGPATIVKTTSQSASSEGESAMVAPRSASGSALERVRFHTATSQPARRSLDASS